MACRSVRGRAPRRHSLSVCRWDSARAASRQTAIQKPALRSVRRPHPSRVVHPGRTSLHSRRARAVKTCRYETGGGRKCGLPKGEYVPCRSRLTNWENLFNRRLQTATGNRMRILLCPRRVGESSDGDATLFRLILKIVAVPRRKRRYFTYSAPRYPPGAAV